MILILALFLALIGPLEAAVDEKMVFVTVADSKHYPILKKCLSSILETNQPYLNQIAVFDLGFTSAQKEYLKQLPFVKVYDIEPVNPYIFTKFIVRPNGRRARGWYSWKPVVIKQALDMFPAILYLDCSMQVKQPLTPFFDHIRENGYFLIACPHDGRRMTTQPVIKKFGLDREENRELLAMQGLEAGLQGLTRALYAPYVYPLYELAKEIIYFEDDGSAPLGFGFARHDQTLFNIYAQLLNLTLIDRENCELTLSGRRVSLNFDDYIGFKNLKRETK